MSLAYYELRDHIATEARLHPKLEDLVERVRYGANLSKAQAAESVERFFSDLEWHVERATKTKTQRPRR